MSKPRSSVRQFFRLSRVDASTWTHPPGTAVAVRRDDGSDFVTRTRSASWNFAPGVGLVLVQGITGGYSLDRVRIATLAEAERLAEAESPQLKLL